MHVIVATDGSTQSRDAAAFLRRLADAATVERVTVVAVVSPLAVVPFADDSASLEEMSFRASAERATESLAASLRDWGPTIETQVRSGRPASELVKAARTLGAQLLVLATSGGSWETRLLGSVANRVINDAPCPVLVVRPAGR